MRFVLITSSNLFLGLPCTSFHSVKNVQFTLFTCASNTLFAHPKQLFFIFYLTSAIFLYTITLYPMPSYRKSLKEIMIETYSYSKSLSLVSESLQTCYHIIIGSIA